jgi:hypothetical protein
VKPECNFRLSQAPLGERDCETRGVLGDGPRAVLAWWGGWPHGQGGAGGFRKKPEGKEISRDGDTSRLIGADHDSITTRNNFVCEL